MRTTSCWLFVIGACHTSHPIPNVAHTTCPSPRLLEHAVCTCEDLNAVGDLHVVSGPAGTGSIGVNGATDLVADTEVAGTWIAWGGFSAVGASIGDSLITPESASVVGDLTIAGDAVIGGDLDAVGTLDIRGSLDLGGSDHVVGDRSIAARGTYVAPTAPPCGCDDQRFFDVAGAVSLARETFGEVQWTHDGSTAQLQLSTGSYYVAAAQLVGGSNIEIDGRVSLFVDGSLDSVGTAQWTLGAGAQLDLFVSGDVDSVGDLVAGDAAAPGAFRLYVGGDQETTVGDTTFYGSLYAPRAAVRYVGDLVIVGSIFARTIEGVGSLTIAYGAAAAPPSSCDARSGSPRSPLREPGGAASADE